MYWIAFVSKLHRSLSDCSVLHFNFRSSDESKLVAVVYMLAFLYIPLSSLRLFLFGQ